MAPPSAFRPASQSHTPPLPPNGFTPKSTLISATVELAEAYSRTNPLFRLPGALPKRCLTKPSEPAHNQGFDNAANDLILHVGDVLDCYTVLDLLGTGTFGQVVRCREPKTNGEVAVKVIKRHAAFKNQAWIEISILRLLHHARDSKHIVRFLTHFVHRDHLCLVFELLNINLYQLLKQSHYRGLTLKMLRGLLRQLLQALGVLVRCGIIHCDLKPENILLADSHAVEIKLIDFGSACQLEHPVYSYVQSRFYRSPEVLLGLPQYDSQIDMWSFGCVAAELFLGIPLFPGQNEMNMVSRIVDMLGPMPDLFLCRCRNTPKFFNIRRTFDGTTDVRTHALKTVQQFEKENICSLPPSKQYFQQRSLEDIISRAPWKSEAPHTEEIELRKSFVDFLRGLLKVDPLERLTPHEAMQHPFIQSGPLPNGQPWLPPGKPRRVPRMRPVAAIDIPSESGDDGAVFASSAPPLRGHPRSSASSESFNSRASGSGIPSNAWGPHYTAGDSAIATGSYIPPPSFYAHAGATGASFGPVPPIGGPGHGLAGKALMRRNGGSSFRPSVNDPNSPRLRPLPVPYGGSTSRRTSLHHSASRDSLGGLHRVPSPGNVVDEPMFPFGPDDDTGSSRMNAAWGTPSSSGPPSSYGMTGQTPGTNASYGASSYGHTAGSYGVPPPGPSSYQGLSSLGTAYNSYQPGAVSYGYYGRAPMRLQGGADSDWGNTGNGNCSSNSTMRDGSGLGRRAAAKAQQPEQKSMSPTLH